MNIAKLKQARAAAFSAAEALAALENPTAEDRTAMDGHLAQIKQLDADINRAESLAALKPAGNPSPGLEQREPARVHNNAEDEPYRNLGEMLQEVRMAASSPSSITPRLQKRAALGANEKVGSEGGFLVGKDEGGAILEEMHEVGILAPRCTEIPITANSNGVDLKGVDETSRADGSRWGGVQAYWADEAATVTATKPKFRDISLKLKKLLALFYATDELLADAAALGAMASKAFAEEIAFKLDDGIFRGPGAGQLAGILNSGTLVSVAKETGQPANTVLQANISKMWSRLSARSKQNAAWFINTEVEPELDSLNIPIGTGGALVYMPPGGLSEAPYGRLKGRPVIPIEHASALGTVGDIVLADMSQYLLATKGGLQQAQSMHVAFLTSEQAFRFTCRVDGQTLRSTPLTPYKGSNTLSAFVALATRA